MALFRFFRDQLFTTLPYPQESTTDQTVIVTSTNVGLGFEAARQFVRLGTDKVVLAVRDLEKGEPAKKAMLKTEKHIGVVEVWPLDLCSYKSVKQFAERAESTL